MLNYSVFEGVGPHFHSMSQDSRNGARAVQETNVYYLSLYFTALKQNSTKLHNLVSPAVLLPSLCLLKKSNFVANCFFRLKIPIEGFSMHISFRNLSFVLQCRALGQFSVRCWCKVEQIRQFVVQCDYQLMIGNHCCQFTIIEAEQLLL